MAFETKVVTKLQSEAKEAVENYQKLGYRILSANESINTIAIEDEVIQSKVTTLTLERDKEIPCYNRLVDIEKNIEKLEGLLNKEKDNLFNHNFSSKRALANGFVGFIFSFGYIFAFICAAISGIMMLAEFTTSVLITTIIFIGIGVGIIALRKFFGKKIENKKETTPEIEELKTKIKEYYDKAEKILNEK